MIIDSEEQIEREIQKLWLRRARLSHPETERLYRLVSGFLKRKYLPHYATLRHCIPHRSLDDLKSQLIDEFYVDVVYRRALQDDFQEKPLDHLGALLSFYERNLKDQMRRCKQQRKLENALKELREQRPNGDWPHTGRLDSDAISTRDDPPNAWAQSPDDGMQPDDSFDSDDVANSPGEEAPAEDDAPSSDLSQDDRAGDVKKGRIYKVDERSYASLSRQFHLIGADDDLETAESARVLLIEANAFLDHAESQRLARDEPPWVLLYLACHFCQPDSETRVSMGTLAARHGIRSYHTKAQKLGVTWTLGGFASFDAFGQTLLGQWLQDVGIAINREHLSEIRAALKILCQAALDRLKAHDEP